MTNPTPDYGFKVKFTTDSHHHHPQSIEKINLVTTTSVEGPLQDALLSPETAVIGTSTGMELKVSNPIKPPSSKINGIIKKSDATSSIKNGNNKRKLTFNVDERNDIIEDTYTYPFPADTDDNDVWWMDDELDQLLTDAMIIADHYTRKRKDWQNKMKSIMKTLVGCSKKKDKDGGCSAPTTLKASDLDFVVDSEARGLELYIHPIFQKNREKAIKGVIKVQEDYNVAEKKKGKADPELRLKVLRAQSLKLTNLARLMAKTLADGDRRAAKDEEGIIDDLLIAAGKSSATGTTGEESSSNLLVKESSIKSEDMIRSEELETKGVVCAELSEELKAEAARPAPRPRARSPMRTISPRRAQFRSCGLKASQLQDQERMNIPNRMGSGGIGALKAALDDMAAAAGDDKQ